MSTRKVFVICGEASGDLHASNLVRELRTIDPRLTIQGWGGDRLKAEQVEVLKHIRELSFMGFLEVFLNLFTILNNFKTCKAQIESFAPDVLILVDFPGFNLRMAEWAKQKGIKVVYYISPQLWAWKQNRIKKVKAYVDEMYCILPFEQEFYKNFNIDVKYFGHPLLDEIVRFNALNLESLPFEKPILALLPGSRLQEVRRKLPIMLEAAKGFPEYQVVVACSAQIPPDFYANFNTADVSFLLGKTYEILNEAAIAFVTSGTATLETALFDVPQVVCYKSSGLSFWIAKRVVKIKYISLVNLILGKGLVTELIQQDCNSKQLIEAMKRIAIDGPDRDAMLQGYKELKLLLGGEGASKRIATSIHETFLR